MTAVYADKPDFFSTGVPALWDEIAEKADALIYAAAAWGACSMWGAHWTIGLEKRVVPSVYVVDEPFVGDVKITLKKEGMPSLRTVISLNYQMMPWCSHIHVR